MIVKNKVGTPDAPIPPGTLTQAGSISVATSKAWETKALMPSWWVHAHQVSRTNERGEVLANGAFMVKGEKNYLAPGQPVLGFAVLFQISKESVQNHRKHRIEEPAEAEPNEVVSPETGPIVQDDAAGVKEAVKEDVPDVPEERVQQPEIKWQVEEEDSSSESEKEAEDEKPKSNPLQPSTGNADEAIETQAQPEDEAGANDEDDLEDEIDATSTINQDENPQPESNVATSKPTPAATKQKTTRGKKAKAKKAAQKYAHQDEEDRELALRLLGANTKATTKAAESAAEAKAKREAELEAQKQRRRAQHERAAQAERKRQEQFLQKRREAGAEADGEDETYNDETVKQEAEDLSWLPALVGTPLPEDEVLAAIPVAAPWSVVARFKYRAKLQAGNIKKGKAIKEILGHWIIEAGGAPGAGTGTGGAGNKIAKKVIADDVAEGLDRATAERMRAREADLLKGWRDVEVMNTLPVGKVRIVSSGVAGGAGGGGGKGDKGGGGKGKGAAPKGGKGGKKK